MLFNAVVWYALVGKDAKKDTRSEAWENFIQPCGQELAITYDFFSDLFVLLSVATMPTTDGEMDVGSLGDVPQWKILVPAIMFFVFGFIIDIVRIYVMFNYKCDHKTMQEYLRLGDVALATLENIPQMLIAIWLYNTSGEYGWLVWIKVVPGAVFGLLMFVNTTIKIIGDGVDWVMLSGMLVVFLCNLTLATLSYLMFKYRADSHFLVSVVPTFLVVYSCWFFGLVGLAIGVPLAIGLGAIALALAIIVAIVYFALFPLIWYIWIFPLLASIGLLIATFIHHCEHHDA